jgi:hypothetical protein
VAELRPKIGEIRAKGAELCAVGNGTAKQAKYFVEHEHIDFAVRTDPTLDVYRRAGFKRGFFATFDPRAALSLVRARLHGHAVNTTVKGDAFQQGGVLIVAPGGREVWRHVNRHAGDHASADAVVSKLEKA